MVRRAFVFDANNITKLWHEMHREVAPRKTFIQEHDNVTTLFINLVARIESPDWHVAVYEEDGKTVGFIMGCARWPTYNRCHMIASCEALYVDPEHRNNNIHCKLMDSFTTWATDNNINEYEFVGPYSEVSIRFWDRLGYVPVSVTYRQKEN